MTAGNLDRTDFKEGRYYHWNVMHNNEVEELMATTHSFFFFQYLEDPDGIPIDLIMPDNEYVSHNNYTEW